VRLAVVAGLTIASSAATVAHAEPVAGDATAYAIGGGALGSTPGNTPELAGGVTLDAGARIAGPLWAHGFAEVGSIHTGPAMGDDDVIARGAIYALRGGVELRRCISDHAVCGIAGEDVGGWLVAWHDAGAPDDGGPALIAATRLAVDAGDRRRGGLRVRLGVEAVQSISALRSLGGDVSFGVGYQW
jgi:hypothetical protein